MMFLMHKESNFGPSRGHSGKFFSFCPKKTKGLLWNKNVSLLLILEGKQPDWIIDLLGPTLQSLDKRMHKVNEGKARASLSASENQSSEPTDTSGGRNWRVI